MTVTIQTLYDLANGDLEPTRVVEGVDPLYTISASRARKQCIPWDYILVRKDGWSIGCRHQWLTVTWQLWDEHWIAGIRMEDQQVVLIGVEAVAELIKEPIDEG